MGQVQSQTSHKRKGTALLQECHQALESAGSSKVDGVNPAPRRVLRLGQGLEFVVNCV